MSYSKVASRNKRKSQKEDRIWIQDRYIPNRLLVNFNSHLISPGGEENLSDPQIFDKHRQLKMQMENVLNETRTDRVMNFESRTSTRIVTTPVWPCHGRTRRLIHKEKALDIPDFNSGFCLGTVLSWRPYESFQSLHHRKGVFSDMNTIDWSPSDWMALAFSDQILVGKNYDRKTVLQSFNNRCTALKWSPNGYKLAVGSYNGIQVWNNIEGKIVFEKTCCEDVDCLVTCIAWHPKQNEMFWACTQGAITSQSFGPTKKEFYLEDAHDDPITNIKLSPQGEFIASASSDHRVRAWRTANFDHELEIKLHKAIRAICWHPWRSALLAIAEGERNARYGIWNVNSSQLLYMSDPYRNSSIQAMDFNKVTGELVLSKLNYESAERDSDDESEGVREVLNTDILVLSGPGKVVDCIEKLPGTICSLIWNPDGTRLGIAGSDEILQLYSFCPAKEKPQAKEAEDLNTLAAKRFKCTLR